MANETNTIDNKYENNIVLTKNAFEEMLTHNVIIENASNAPGIKHYYQINKTEKYKKEEINLIKGYYYSTASTSQVLEPKAGLKPLKFGCGYIEHDGRITEIPIQGLVNVVETTTGSEEATTTTTAISAAGTSMQFLRGDGQWSNTLWTNDSNSLPTLRLVNINSSSTAYGAISFSTVAAPNSGNEDRKGYIESYIDTSGATYLTFRVYSHSENKLIQKPEIFETHLINNKGVCTLEVKNGDIKANKVYNAVFNDYAEYRATTSARPGQCVVDNDDGTMRVTNARLMPGASVVSDTFGTAMGMTDNCKTPLAVAGRVLVYPARDRNEYHAGMAVCSSADGKVDIMTREEIRDYPDCIVGIVSEIPNYEVWGSDNVKVDGRIWIKVR